MRVDDVNVQRSRKKPCGVYLQFSYHAAVAERYCDKSIPIFTALCIANPKIYL